MHFFVHFTYKKMPTGQLFSDLNIFSRNSSRNECGEYVRGKEVKQVARQSNILQFGLRGKLLGMKAPVNHTPFDFIGLLLPALNMPYRLRLVGLAI